MPQFFIERPIFAWVVALGIALAGLLAILNMPISQYPEVAPPAIKINATYPGASAEDVASSVASVIENELNGAKRSEEHTSELQSLMRISYAVFCLKKKKTKQYKLNNDQQS